MIIQPNNFPACPTNHVTNTSILRRLCRSEAIICKTSVKKSYVYQFCQIKIYLFQQLKVSYFPLGGSLICVLLDPRTSSTTPWMSCQTMLCWRSGDVYMAVGFLPWYPCVSIQIVGIRACSTSSTYTGHPHVCCDWNQVFPRAVCPVTLIPQFSHQEYLRIHWFVGK
jgi:hypothetical protein